MRLLRSLLLALSLCAYSVAERTAYANGPRRLLVEKSESDVATELGLQLCEGGKLMVEGECMEQEEALKELEDLVDEETALKEQLKEAESAEAEASDPAEKDELADEVEELAEEAAEVLEEIRREQPVLAFLQRVRALHAHHQNATVSAFNRHVRPALGWDERAEGGATFGQSSQRFFEVAHTHVSKGVAEYTGSDEDSAHVGYLTAAILIFPIFIWAFSLGYLLVKAAHMNVLRVLAKMGNWFWACYSMLLLFAVLAAGHDPLHSFHLANHSEYVLFQFTKAVLFLSHMLILLAQLAILPSMFHALQLGVTIVVGIHYYSFAWHPAMLENPPMLSWRSFAFYAYLFLLICLIPNRAEKARAE
eukprot:CAMPEP_0170141628 /NCGR_PEP_ID=MMETSP0033_2-20121228/7128_1 /TAXON_ID=195969 /ORGANISM="Dolichomastix tenuilepis, Strain CCMP3274" /LENGTH=362 /DNA_ID=CAMNT_0010377911 /DNA_START=23 /DNA_END=1111 /DNA_ORIENTATION=-